MFVRFVACARGLTPSFATGPFDALNAVATSRVRDAYELHLVSREGLDDGFDGLPSPGPDLAGVADPAARRAQLQDAILDSYPASGRAGSPGDLDPLPEHPQGLDPTAVFLARVVVPVGAADPPARAGAAPVVDSWARRFVPSAHVVVTLDRCVTRQGIREKGEGRTMRGISAFSLLPSPLSLDRGRNERTPYGSD